MRVSRSLLAGLALFHEVCAMAVLAFIQPSQVSTKAGRPVYLMK